MKTKYPVIELNEAQKKVVEWVDGPLLVSAGPGSGKTRVIIERIARLLEKGIKHESILATTFTRKAADEMNTRLEAKNVNVKRMAVQTMHALCWRIIREHKNFRGWNVDGKDDGKEVHRLVIKSVTGYKNMNWIGCDISFVESFIAYARNSLIAPEKSHGFMNNVFKDPRYAQAYMLYSEEMAARRLMTFDDMLYYGVRLLETDSHLLDRMRGQYTYIMVDEFQDSNFAQLQLADLLARPMLNYVVVGDIDQAIYSWRGALPEFMLEFQSKYNAEIIELNTNYRCAPKIMEAAARCIQHNRNRFTKDLNANRVEEATIKFSTSTTTDDEATVVREQIQLLRADNVGYGGMKVLMRTNAQSRAIEEEFVRHKIPFVVLGSVSFYERKEIKDLICYLRLLHDPRDITSGERAISRPFRFIGRKQLDQIREETERCGSYLNAVESSVNNLRAFEFVQLVRQFDVESDSPADILRTIIQDTDYLDYIKREEGSDTVETSRAGNISELIASATRFKTVEEFIDYIDMQIRLRKRNQREKSDSRVQVMTVHKSKGTESNAIWLIGANDGVIPHAKGDEEEERRLFYVAMTRAKDHLYISTVCNETMASTSVPSRFIYEAKIAIDKGLTPDDESSTFIEHSASEGQPNENLAHLPCGTLSSVYRRDES